MLAEYERSGMTGAQFARFVGVRYSTLMHWLQKRRKQTAQGEHAASSQKDHPGWLEAHVEGEVPEPENVVVELGGEIRMLVGSRTQAALAGEVLRRWGWVGDVKLFREPAFSWRWKLVTC